MSVKAVVDDAGRGGSFEDLYRTRYAHMVQVARMLVGSGATAEEIVQDAFLALYPRFATLDEPAGYLYRAVVNGCRSSHRRRLVRERARGLRVATEVPPPEVDETRAALARLAPRRRAVVVLRFYADLPLAGIAEVLGCSTGTVKSQLHHALAQLKEVIER